MNMVGPDPESVRELDCPRHDVLGRTGAGLGIARKIPNISTPGPIARTAPKYRKMRMVASVKEPTAVRAAMLREGQNIVHLSPPAPRCQQRIDLSNPKRNLHCYGPSPAHGGLPLLNPESRSPAECRSRPAPTAWKKAHGGRGIFAWRRPGVPPAR